MFLQNRKKCEKNVDISAVMIHDPHNIERPGQSRAFDIAFRRICKQANPDQFYMWVCGWPKPLQTGAGRLRQLRQHFI